MTTEYRTSIRNKKGKKLSTDIAASSQSMLKDQAQILSILSTSFCLISSLEISWASLTIDRGSVEISASRRPRNWKNIFSYLYTSRDIEDYHFLYLLSNLSFFSRLLSTNLFTFVEHFSSYCPYITIVKYKFEEFGSMLKKTNEFVRKGTWVTAVAGH